MEIDKYKYMEHYKNIDDVIWWKYITKIFQKNLSKLQHFQVNHMRNHASMFCGNLPL